MDEVLRVERSTGLVMVQRCALQYVEHIESRRIALMEPCANQSAAADHGTQSLGQASERVGGSFVFVVETMLDMGPTYQHT